MYTHSRQPTPAPAPAHTLYDRSVTQLSQSHMIVSEGMRELYKKRVWNHPTAKNATSTSWRNSTQRGRGGGVVPNRIVLKLHSTTPDPTVNLEPEPIGRNVAETDTKHSVYMGSLEIEPKRETACLRRTDGTKTTGRSVSSFPFIHLHQRENRKKKKKTGHPLQ